MKPLLAFLLLASAAFAKDVSLTWTDTANPVGTTYSVKRSPGICSGTPVFATIMTGVAVKTFVDANVPVGNYCYVVTATFSGIESAASNSAGATVPTTPPSLNPPTVAKLLTQDRELLAASVSVPLEITFADLF